MNDIDLMIRSLLLGFPSLHRNRFDAMEELLTNSCYEWSEDGKIVNIFPLSQATPETMIAEAQAELDKRKADEQSNTSECLNDLRRRYVVEAERELLIARHLAENIDVYTTSYATVSYREIWAWLNDVNHKGINSYWLVNHPPKNINEEWRKAIRTWLGEILAPMNSLMGAHTPKGWVAQERYAKVFTWVKMLYDLYDSEEDKQLREEQNKISKQIIDEILSERAARPY